MNDDFLERQLNQELEAISYNKLTELGNKAIRLKLIIGHGYRGGQYEILRQEKAILMSPDEAQTYLENLIKEMGG